MSSKSTTSLTGDASTENDKALDNDEPMPDGTLDNRSLYTELWRDGGPGNQNRIVLKQLVKAAFEVILRVGVVPRDLGEWQQLIDAEANVMWS